MSFHAYGMMVLYILGKNDVENFFLFTFLVKAIDCLTVEHWHTVLVFSKIFLLYA